MTAKPFHTNTQVSADSLMNYIKTILKRNLSLFGSFWQEFSCFQTSVTILQAFSYFGLGNVLFMRVSSEALSELFVMASCRQPAIYLHTTAITMCSVQLFLDVTLLCFVLQQLKIHLYFAGRGLQI